MADGKENSKKVGNDKALVPVLPGEGKLSEVLINETIAELNRIYIAKGLETARAIGECVLDAFFAGDASKFRERGNGHISFRELGKRADLQVGWHFIWNAVAVVTQAKALPAAVAEVLPLSHHKLLLTVKDDETRVRLAEEAAKEGQSRRDFKERVKQARPIGDGASKAGRPPLPAFVKAFTVLKKAVDIAEGEGITEESFEHFSKEQAKALLTEVEAQLAALNAVAADVRSFVGA